MTSQLLQVQQQQQQSKQGREVIMMSGASSRIRHSPFNPAEMTGFHGETPGGWVGQAEMSTESPNSCER